MNQYRIRKVKGLWKTPGMNTTYSRVKKLVKHLWRSLFCKIFLQRGSIVDVWLGSNYTSAASQNILFYLFDFHMVRFESIYIKLSSGLSDLIPNSASFFPLLISAQMYFIFNGFKTFNDKRKCKVKCTVKFFAHLVTHKSNIIFYNKYAFLVLQELQFLISINSISRTLKI